jgi:hypothetical protein
MSLTLPPAWASTAFEIAAIAVVSPEGELASAATTAFVPAPSAAAAPASSPALDPVVCRLSRCMRRSSTSSRVSSGAESFDARLCATCQPA